MILKKWATLITWVFFTILVGACQSTENPNSPVEATNVKTEKSSPVTVLTDTNLKVDTSKIYLKDDFFSSDKNKDRLVNLNGTTYYYALYENRAYQCGLSGFYNFFVLQKASFLDQQTDNWIYFRGGGMGYYFNADDGTKYYLPAGEGINDSPSIEKYVDRLSRTTFNPDGSTKKNVMGRRLEEGTRTISLAYCDHDIYMGAGHPYPNSSNAGATVDGLTASVSAILYVNENFPNAGNWLHGTSAGSAGAYNVSRGLINMGLKPKGVLLDSYTLNSKRYEVIENKCKPYREEIETELGLNLEDQVTLTMQKALGNVDEKYMESLEKELLENFLGKNEAPPYFILQGAADGYCCGRSGEPTLPGNAHGGFSGNCEYVNSVFDHGLKKGTSSARLSRKIVAPKPFGHVISNDTSPEAQTAFQSSIEEWIELIRQNNN